MGPDQPYDDEGGTIDRLDEFEHDIALLGHDIQQVDAGLGAAFERIERLELAIRTMADHPGSPHYAARAARDVLNGERVPMKPVQGDL